MIEFRNVELPVPRTGSKIYFEVKLFEQYRHWRPFIGASGDIILDNTEWTDWVYKPHPDLEKVDEATKLKGIKE